MRSLPCFGVLLLVGCSGAPREDVAAGVLVARLEGEGLGFSAVRDAIRAQHPGYDIEWLAATRALDAVDAPRVVFIQRGECEATVTGEFPMRGNVEVGAALALRPLERVDFATPVDLLVFAVPQPFGPDVPVFLRPDFDPRIDDQQGGCATEDRPYRRLLLTWRPENGPYVHHGLNAHRVRIVDSFTHYHPRDGGFDEMYLVQHTTPTARLLTSSEREAVEQPDSVDSRAAERLFQTRSLRTHDLVFIPRGVLHRGVGGAVVLVITIPGFRPGAEIGVDHHLRAIAERCARDGEVVVVPYHVEASAAPTIR